MKEQRTLVVDSVNILSNNWIDILLVDPDGSALPQCEPGQFVEVAERRSGVLLNRPFSIYNATDHSLELLIAPVGRASSHMASYLPGDRITVIMPLGHGFSNALPGAKVLLVGGGVGIAPLYFQARHLALNGAKPTIIYGMRTASDPALVDRYARICPIEICTDDGSAGFHGVVTRHPAFNPSNYDLVQICGPKPMMKACAKICADAGTCTEVSLENHMACGLGACLCCVEDTQHGNVCVCKEGPVFNINVLKW